MSKAKKPKDFAFDEKLTAKTPTDPDPIDPSDEELDNVFREFPQHDACLELWRTTEKGGKPSFLGDITPTDFTFGNIMREFGGGRYIVKGKYKDGEIIKRSFDIEGAPFPIKRRVPEGTPVSATPVLAAPTVELSRREDGSYDLGALVTAMMGMMKSLVQESKGSKAEWLDELKSMRELFGGQEKAQTPIHEAIGMIKTGIELGSASQGGDGGFPWLLALDKLQGPLTELVSTIKAAVTQRGGVPAPGPSLRPLPGHDTETGQPLKGTPEPQPQGDPPNMEMILKSAIGHVLPNLVTGAAKEADPGFYADFLLDQIPRRFYDTAQTWLNRPDCLEQLKGMNPGVVQHEAWFGALRVELLKALTEELSDAPGTVQPEPTPNASADRSADL